MIRVLTISILILFIFSPDAFSQHNKELINPYVNLSEQHWLKTQKIDLTRIQIKDKEFIRNVRLILELKSQDREAIGKFSGFIAVGIFSLLNYRYGDYADSTGAFTNTLLGSIGATSVCLATKYFSQHKNLSSKKHQLLRLTQDQYKLYIQ